MPHVRSLSAARRVGSLFTLCLLLTAPAFAAEPEASAPVDEEVDDSAYSAYRIAPVEVWSENRPALAPNEPMYFVAGSDGDTIARFQFSFQYRIFDEDSDFVRWASWMKRMHLGYTQTSLWNLSADSKPFGDTSYRPSVFYQRIGLRDGWSPDFLRFGYEHESNGQAAERSRSIDTLMLHPGWVFDLDGRQLLIAPKVYAYLDKEDNSRIDHYRGYTDLLIRYGDERSWVASTTLRLGRDGHGSAQIDLSYPLRRPIFARTGGYFYLQMFQGYGNSLIEYDRAKGLQVRIGLAIVR